MTLRRSIPFWTKKVGGVAPPQKLPTEVANLMSWHDATNFASITFDGANIAQINDLSGNARHLTQATPARRPLYEATGLTGGYPTISFDGANDEFMTASVPFVGYPMTVFYMIEYVSGTGFPWSLLQVSSNNKYFTFGPSSSTYFGSQTIRNSTSAAIAINSSINSDPAIICSSVDTGVQSLIKISSPPDLDGNFSGVHSALFPDVDTLLLGKLRIVTSAGQYTGKLSEIFTYSVEPSIADKNLLFNYLSNKYGVTAPVAI